VDKKQVNIFLFHAANYKARKREAKISAAEAEKLAKRKAKRN